MLSARGLYFKINYIDTFRKLFALREYVLMMMTSTTEINVCFLSYLKKVIDTVKLPKALSNYFITDT